MQIQKNKTAKIAKSWLMIKYFSIHSYKFHFGPCICVPQKLEGEGRCPWFHWCRTGYTHSREFHRHTTHIHNWPRPHGTDCSRTVPLSSHTAALLHSHTSNRYKTLTNCINDSIVVLVLFIHSGILSKDRVF